MESPNPHDIGRLGWDAALLLKFANQIKRVLSPTRLNDLGRRVGFCYRERLITPYRLVLSLLASHATGSVETLADIQRQFNALFGTNGRV